MKENTNIFDRILQIVDSYGLKNVNELADVLGYSSAEKLYRLNRKPDAKPSFEIIEDLSNKFDDLNIKWFVSGKGPLKSSDISKVSVSPTVSPAISPAQKFNLPAVVTIDTFGHNNIALVGVRARAGYLNGYADPEYIEKLPVYNIPGTEHRTLRAFEVEGHSMNPTLSNRDIVFAEWLEQLEDIREDRVHVLVTKTEGIIIKRLLNRVNQYGYVIAKSDAYNQRNEYRNLQIGPEDIQEIWYCRLNLSADFRSPTDVWNRMNNMEADLEEIKRLVGIKQQLNRL